MAYKALVGKYHPDRNPSCEKSLRAMQVINASYEVLSNPDKRARHDRWITKQNEFYKQAHTQSNVVYDSYSRSATSQTKTASPTPQPTATQQSPHVEPAKNASSSSSGCGCLALIAIGVVVFVLFISQSDNATPPRASYSPPSSVTQPTIQSAPTPPPFNEPIVALPDNGELVVKANYSLVAPFQIKSQGGENYLLKLTDAESGVDVMTVFVRGGETVETRAPLGTFIVKYASGTTWYGYEYLFGPSTTYSKADETFAFTRSISSSAQNRLIAAQRRLAIIDAEFRTFFTDRGMPARQASYLFDGTDSNSGKSGLDRIPSSYWKEYLTKVRSASLHNAIVDRLNARNQISNDIVQIRNQEENIEGISLTLYKVQNGNLQTSKISASDF